ncbi:hypothetical protein [Rhodococcus sp. NPDC127528]|uniref:hypothetical protein n=1 Tax=unclassified Rhodococcus (in: high G+C Gram-positive bacteria) TaxID=192944 RepID=UPI00363AF67F
MTLPPTKRDSGGALNQPPTVKFWLIVFGVVAAIGLGVAVAVAIQASNEDSSERREIIQQKCINANPYNDPATLKKCVAEHGL